MGKFSIPQRGQDVHVGRKAADAGELKRFREEFVQIDRQAGRLMLEFA
jgi:hypothetical protein